MVVDRRAQVGGSLPVSVLVHAAFENILVAKSRPPIGSEVQCLAIGMDIRRALIVGRIDFRAKVARLAPLAAGLQSGVPKIVAALPPLPIAHEIECPPVGA